MPELSRLSATVHGYVQGVGFRFFVVARARALGLIGYVRNPTDRSKVEVCAEGERADLEDLLQSLERGPLGAVVEKVDACWDAYKGEFKDFEIRF